MKKIGNIDIAFKNYNSGVYYYNVHIEINGKTILVVLPRYDVFLGWIEVFGLPPQNEWVVLDTLDNFKKNAPLIISNKVFEESVAYTAGEDSHTIAVVRSNEMIEEKCVWKQNYMGAPQCTTSEVIFEHNEGTYQLLWETSVSSDVNTVVGDDFLRETVENSGAPDLIVTKKFKTSGQLPFVYYSIFPIQEIVDLQNSAGSVTELGYMKKDSPHKVDHVHGDWFKRFAINDKVFYVKESNYASCDLVTEAGIVRIKDTYQKELFIL